MNDCFYWTGLKDNPSQSLKRKKNINFINLIEFPSFTYARYAALSDDCFVHSLTETLRLEVQAIGII